MSARRRRTGTASLVVLGVAIMSLAFGVGAWSRAATRPSQAGPPEVLGVKASAVRQVVLESGGKKVELQRDADGNWSAGPGVPPEAGTLLSGSEDRLFPLRAYRTVPVDANLPEFGLQQPEISVTAQDRRGREHRIHLGAPTFSTAGVYARQVGVDGRVYLVPRRMMDDLRSVLAGHPIAAVDDLPQRVSELREEKAETEANAVSWWLQQVLDADETPEGES